MADEVVAKSKEAMKQKKQAEQENLPEEPENKSPVGEQDKVSDEDRREDAKEEEEDPENAEMIDTTNAQKQQDEKKDEDQEKKKLSDEHFEYKLVGVVIHMGNADAGHYLSYINVERGYGGQLDWADEQKQKWLEFNDSNVKDFSFKQ